MQKVFIPLHPQTNGAIAQLVEQRTENPCVPGSIPGGTTKNPSTGICGGVFFSKCGYIVATIYDVAHSSPQKPLNSA